MSELNTADPSPQPGPIGLLLVDDESLMRSGLRLLLDGAAGLSVLGEAAEGREALAQIDRLRPDVVLLDLRMPVMTGMEVLAELQRREPPQPTPAVVVLTAFDTDQWVLQALRWGAAGFVLKSASPTVLVAAVRAAAEGQPLISPQVLRRLVDLAPADPGDPPPPRSPATAMSPPPSRLATLSAREREIADLVAEGLTNQQIADRLFVTVPTVKTHLARLMEKVGAANRVHVTIAVLEDQR